MTKVSDGYYKITVEMGGTTKVAMCFNDGGSTWDNNNSNDYTFKSGKYTVASGSVTSGAPAGIKDTDNGSGSGSDSGNVSEKETSSEGESTDTESTDESGQGDVSVEEETTGKPGSDSTITIGPLEDGTDNENATEKEDEPGKKNGKASKDDGFSWSIVIVVSVIGIVIAAGAVVGVLAYKGKIDLFKKKEKEIK